MLGQPTLAMYQLNRYYQERVGQRKGTISKNIHELCKIVHEILKEVEAQEPRFISTMVENSGRYEGVYAVSGSEFEVILYLNQMGVFNFVDDGTLPGCAVLKLSDGRKRSMSLWVEFITASGYLSARKIRSRFQTLVAQAVDKCQYREIVKMIQDTSEVKLRIKERYIVQITTAFRLFCNGRCANVLPIPSAGSGRDKPYRTFYQIVSYINNDENMVEAKCQGIWPRSAAHWPTQGIPWPCPAIIHEVKQEGFDLFSKEPSLTQGKQSTMEGDAWMISFTQAEDILLASGCRRKCFSILKSLRDRHLEMGPGGVNPITPYILKTLILFECEKHPHDSEWDELACGDRIIGVLLQLVSCLQCRKCPHYFIPSLDLMRGKSNALLDQTAKQTWRLLRELITNHRALETL